MEQQECVILVDQQNNQLGIMEKLEAHKRAVLHRAFSIFIFNPNGQLLLQQRALTKYHSAGLWTNTCCSHPRPGEDNMEAAHRRLREEMGFDCALEEKFHFIYKATLENGLTEHELDFIYTGLFDGDITVNKDEVSGYRWISMNELIADVKLNPQQYTSWFRIILEEYVHHL
jgi:isopentenyl-diphosphate delta-isomerase